MVDCQHQEVELSSYKLWTLPLCWVTVYPKNLRSFWDAVKGQASEAGDRDPLDRVGRPRCTAEDSTLASGSGAAGVSQTVCLASAGRTQVVQGDHILPQGEVCTLPMFKAVPNSGHADRHNVFARMANGDPGSAGPGCEIWPWL